MGLRIVEYRWRHFEGVRDLYRAHDWKLGDDADLLGRCLDESFAIVALVDDEVVGVIRCLTDYAQTVYIGDVLVHPAHEGKGIGREMMHALRRVYFPIAAFGHQVLIADPEACGFYEAIGMVTTEAAGAGTGYTWPDWS